MASYRCPPMSTVKVVPGVVKSRKGKPKAMEHPKDGECAALLIHPTSRSPLNNLAPVSGITGSSKTRPTIRRRTLP